MARREPILASFSSRAELSDEQKARQERAKREYGRLWREWSELFATASEGALLPLERIQKNIPDDAALVLWIEQLGEQPDQDLPGGPIPPPGADAGPEAGGGGGRA